LSEVEAYQVLASKSRLEILKVLYKKPRSIEEISHMMGLQSITVRHHLQSLERAGFVESYDERTGTPGRPKVCYRIAKKPHFVGFTNRRYLTLSNFLMTTMQALLGLDQTRNILRKVGVEMGESTIKKLELECEVKDWSLKNYEEFFINKYLEEVGAEPEIVEANDEKIVYRVHNCVFLGGIRMPEMICDVMHEGFNEGVSAATGKKANISRVACMGKGDRYCEYVCNQPT